MRERIKLIVTLILIVFLDSIVLFIFTFNGNPRIKSIRLLNYNEKTDVITIEVTKRESIIYGYDFYCVATSDNADYIEKGTKNKCELELPIKKDYKIHLENKYNKTETLTLMDHIDNMLEFSFDKDVIYLAVEQETNISYKDKYILPVDMVYDFYSLDENVAAIVDNKIVGKNPGTTYIKVKGSEVSLKVVVTDLISKPTLATTKKEIVPCKAYTEEEATLLDDLLEYYIREAGYGTRAGAVAAGRFLTLQFKYRIPYFYENGRVNNSGVHLADGEGRYYKKGLYLSESKYENILYTYADKKMWGCPLKNGNSNPRYGFIPGKLMPNGLDCSGFVSWALVNGGFDPGDVGAGQNEGIYQLTDTGEFTPLTRDLALSGKIKTGDLFNFWGHIALIIGQDEDNYYVAESLPHLGGVIAKTYPKKTVANTFEFVVFMDVFYKKDGNLTDYWE
ncbi:MAG: hypothetical protein J1F35_07570 [Erysipelotrichales bacterium]|nr:hypothetical protein [Erysipelotrichales bacterium]